MATAFAEQVYRIHQLIGTSSIADLTRFLGIRHSEYALARRRGAVPCSWLVRLLQACNANPAWILSGEGPQFVEDDPSYRHAVQLLEHIQPEMFFYLHTVPARLLADELVRRIEAAHPGHG